MVVILGIALFAVTKYSTEQLKKGDRNLDSLLEDAVYHIREGMVAGGGAAGHIVSTGRKQREMDAGSQLSPLLNPRQGLSV